MRNVNGVNSIAYTAMHSESLIETVKLSKINNFIRYLIISYIIVLSKNYIWRNTVVQFVFIKIQIFSQFLVSDSKYLVCQKNKKSYHQKQVKDYCLCVGSNTSTDLQLISGHIFLSLLVLLWFVHESTRKRIFRGVACFGQLTTGMSTSTFLISLPTSHRCLTSFTQSFPFQTHFSETGTWSKADLPLLNNNAR